MPKTPKIIEAARKFRSELLDGEAKATSEMTRLYRGVYDATLRRLEAVRQEIASDIAQGKAPGAARVFENNRLSGILAQTSAELSRFSKSAQSIIAARQTELMEIAQSHAAELGRVALGPIPQGVTGPTWRKVPTAALEDLVGISGDGSPLSKVLSRLSSAGADQVRAVMLSGIARGATHTEIARQLSTGLGAPLSRSLTVLRTEDMRAYRLSQTRAYEQNKDVISGVTWFASLSSDTCAACLANHGRKFPPDYVMESHPNCRCVLVPITKTWRELGFPHVQGEPSQITESGAAWFNRQSDQAKTKILGKTGFDALSKHGLSLEDFRGHKTNDDWGGMFHVVSPSAAIAAAKAKS